MKLLKTGNFFGDTNQTIHLPGITLTNTEYTHDYVDWHYHENAYFTFLLEGKVLEGNKKEKYTCVPGSLLFHHWQEPHYNIKPKGYTRGMHVELQRKWFEDYGFDTKLLQASVHIINPDVKILLHHLHKEMKLYDDSSEMAIHQLIINVVDRMLRTTEDKMHKKPHWVNRVIEILHDQNIEKITLDHLSKELNIHPVHLSRDFVKHFRCTIGKYTRNIKIEKSLSLFHDRNLSLTDISAVCGFTDQSHFIRGFREINGITPSEYRKMILR